MCDISKKPIKDFLDAVDDVLNSNTFLLYYKPFVSNNLKSALTTFLNASDFYQQVLKQDIERNWYIMHTYEDSTGTYKPKPGKLIKPNIGLQIDIPPVHKRDYLITMLTADQKVQKFVSPYRTQLDKNEAELIVDNFLLYITNKNEWELYTVYPDFLYNAVELYEMKKEEYMRYFEGDYACDTATLITLRDKHFLLLTNGID